MSRSPTLSSHCGNPPANRARSRSARPASAQMRRLWRRRHQSGRDQRVSMFNRAILRQRMPKYLSSHPDPLFRFQRWRANLRILEIDEIKSIPCTPRSHPFIERLIGRSGANISIRRSFGTNAILDASAIATKFTTTNIAATPDWQESSSRALSASSRIPLARIRLVGRGVGFTLTLPITAGIASISRSTCPILPRPSGLMKLVIEITNVKEL
jgi:hypothetical protein